ncbi:hypothetical protein N5D52_28535 [Pseudomonas sp. GD03860]|uniref:linalool dehydratase/isomerase domain-containing protein n=1 Tax=Pseudomonas TaxID=286 RepID=UPI002363575C|nr:MULTISPECIES: hypothetical protein [Pseudomonas]MDD2058439.1 hypothetical protein [Pseudomonas putida]MDH0640879.1 hypothetical protein [Pseudomonas sp. GD03860]
MSSLNRPAADVSAPVHLGASQEGPMTRAKKRRTSIVYILCALLGLVPSVLGAHTALQAFGLGLLFPGAGFFSVGGWALLLVPLTLALYLVALIAWFGSGMIVAPIIIWLGSALLAAGLVGETSSPIGAALAVGLFVLYRIRGTIKQRKAQAQLLMRREERSTYLPTATRAVTTRATEAPPAEQRELSLDELQALRFNLDLALQPIGSFEGFQTIEQFQTSALRYQLNSIGYSLAVMQTVYTPNFQGYVNCAQRNAIDKALNKRVWGYWRWERLWGHFSWRYDPVGRDNIMLTGFLGLQVCLYMASSGDRRYTEPGSLTFTWGKRRFAHDIHSIARSIDENFSRADFCLYPCEPGWIYTPCNFMGMMTLIAYDRLFDTHLAVKHMPRFRENLENEFTLADGDLIVLRNEITGTSVAFPFGNEGLALLAHALLPERARQAWALARRDYVKEQDGETTIEGMEKGVDFGRYRKAPIGHIQHMLGAAGEMGDTAVVNELLRLLEDIGKPTRENGVLKYECSSGLAADMVRSRILRKGDWSRTVNEGPLPCTQRGPLLTQARYPQVLVARAFSHGDDLDMTLYPGLEPGPEVIVVERLKANAHYQLVVCDSQTSVQADAKGQLKLTVMLSGRTSISLKPELQS